MSIADNLFDLFMWTFKNIPLWEDVVARLVRGDSLNKTPLTPLEEKWVLRGIRFKHKLKEITMNELMKPKAKKINMNNDIKLNNDWGCYRWIDES